jgi:hypothetical protein
MSFFINVPTYYIIYKVDNLESASLLFVKECKTRGEAVEWIHKSGEQGANYCIKEYLRK